MNVKTILFQTIQFRVSPQFSPILPVDKCYIYQVLHLRATVDLRAMTMTYSLSASVTGTSPSDRSVSYPGHSLEGFTHLSEGWHTPPKWKGPLLGVLTIYIKRLVEDTGISENNFHSKNAYAKWPVHFLLFLWQLINYFKNVLKISERITFLLTITHNRHCLPVSLYMNITLNLYINIYKYIHTYTHARAHTHTHTHTHTHIYIYIYINSELYSYIYIYRERQTDRQCRSEFAYIYIYIYIYIVIQNYMIS